MDTLFDECEECGNAKVVEDCPECGMSLCEYCLDEHDCFDYEEESC